MTSDLSSWLSSSYQSLATLPKFVDDRNGGLIALTIAIAWFTFTLKRSSVKKRWITNQAIAVLERPQIGAYNMIYKNISIINKPLRHQLRTRAEGSYRFDAELLPARTMPELRLVRLIYQLSRWALPAKPLKPQLMSIRLNLTS
jgi:hypothetical protein